MKFHALFFALAFATAAIADTPPPKIQVDSTNGLGLTPPATITLQAADASHNGALKSSDWSLFSGKEDALTFLSPLSNTGGLVSIDLSGQANTALSNLASPTAVNQSLIPGNTGVNLGSSANPFRSLSVTSVTGTGSGIINANTYHATAGAGLTFLGNALSQFTVLNGGDFQFTSVGGGTFKLNFPTILPQSGATLNMNTGYITSLIDPTNPQDAATKNYVDTHGGGAFLPLAGGTMLGAIDMGGQNITDSSGVLASPAEVSLDGIPNGGPTPGEINLFSGTGAGIIMQASGGAYFSLNSGGDIGISSGGNQDITIDPGSGNVLLNSNLNIQNNGLLNANVVNFTGGTASTALALDSSRNLVSSATTATQLGYLSSTTGDVQTQLNGKQATGSYLTGLSSDVSASGPAVGSATVNSVGGSSAANVHSAELAANAATAANTASTIVKRDGSGNFTAGTITGSLTGGASLDLPLAGGTLSGPVSMGSNLIHSVTDPASAQDAATKNYVDGLVNGLNWKQAALYATAAALPSNTYVNGSSGVGATITEIGNGALSVDGSSPSAGNRVLVKNEVATANNGIYSVTSAGSGGTPFILTRTGDFNSASNISPGDAVLTVDGTSYPTGNKGTSWSLQDNGAVTVGMTALVFGQASGPGSYTNGTGLNLSGLTFSLANPSATTIGGIESIASSASNWIDSISTAGVPHQSRPAFTDVSGNLANGQLPTAETWPSSGTVQAITPSNHGLLISGAGATATVSGIGTDGQLVVGQSAADPLWKTAGGDCTVSAAGAFTCTKTNGASFAAVATSGSATDLSTGTLGTARLPSPFTSGSASGNTSTFGTTSGTLTSGHCVQIDASGNLVDSGGACGGGGSGTVTSVSVASANGFAGSVATATTTPAITVSTSITGVLKGNGTAISAATAGSDYSVGTGSLATGILKSTTSTGALSIATGADMPIQVPLDFGDGSDGSATLDGTNTYTWVGKSGNVYTMGSTASQARDAMLTSLTIATGVTLKLNGWQIFNQGTTTLSGTGSISCDGAPGGNATGTNGTTAGAGGAATVNNSSNGGRIGDVAAGGNGATSLVGACVAGNQVASVSRNQMGGVGGTGGSSGSGTGGSGCATVSNRPLGGLGPFRRVTDNYGSWWFGTWNTLGGGISGSGGAAGAGDSTNHGGGGGGGGAAGSVCFLRSNAIVVGASANISANGGNGGNGGTITVVAGGSGAGGGGGGGAGGGGGVILQYYSLTNSGNISANAGTPGTHGTGGGTGANGADGGSGAAGFVIKFNGTNGTYN